MKFHTFLWSCDRMPCINTREDVYVHQNMLPKFEQSLVLPLHTDLSGFDVRISLAFARILRPKGGRG